MKKYRASNYVGQLVRQQKHAIQAALQPEKEGISSKHWPYEGN